MTDYTKPENSSERPWAKTLEVGDILSAAQAHAVNETRLRDFGLGLYPRGNYFVVRSIAEEEASWRVHETECEATAMAALRERKRKRIR